MAKTYKTSKSNRKLVSNLTRALSLGHENHIGRIAIMFSIKHLADNAIYDIVLNDSGGKEYSSNVLFGDNEELYREVIAYSHSTAVNDPKVDNYIKYHLDRGVELLGGLIFEEQTVVSLEEFVEEFCL